MLFTHILRFSPPHPHTLTCTVVFDLTRHLTDTFIPEFHIFLLIASLHFIKGIILNKIEIKKETDFILQQNVQSFVFPCVLYRRQKYQPMKFSGYTSSNSDSRSSSSSSSSVN